jgi:hypothetical protein
MANRDQNWGFGGRGGGDRGRRDEARRNERGRGPEQRSFGEDRGHEGGEPWRGEGRYGARYDQERTGYGARDDRDRGGYGGQAYGMEGGRDHRAASERDRDWGGDERETWRPDQGEPYGDLELNARNRGVQEFGPPADYAYHPRAGHEFDPDYLHWRESQMRNHDRDYEEWRRSQHQSYDDDYRSFRSERRERFGETFQAWRSQRNASSGVSPHGVGPETGDTAKATGHAGGNLGDDRPSGMIEPPGHLTGYGRDADREGPIGAQAAGGPQSGQGGKSGGDKTPEFGREPPPVRAASDGDKQR